MYYGHKTNSSIPIIIFMALVVWSFTVWCESLFPLLQLPLSSMRYVWQSTSKTTHRYASSLSITSTAERDCCLTCFGGIQHQGGRYQMRPAPWCNWPEDTQGIYRSRLFSCHQPLTQGERSESNVETVQPFKAVWINIKVSDFHFSWFVIFNCYMMLMLLYASCFDELENGFRANFQ